MTWVKTEGEINMLEIDNVGFLMKKARVTHTIVIIKKLFPLFNFSRFNNSRLSKSLDTYICHFHEREK